MCIGPMARQVEDLFPVLSIIAGPDGIDPYAVPAPLGDPGAVEVAKLSVGYYHDDGLVRVSDETAAAVERAADLLARAGARVSAAKPPEVRDATQIFLSLAGADGGRRTLRDLAGCNGRHHEQFRDLLASFGASMSLTDFFDLQGRAFEFRRRYRAFIADYDVVICPVTTGPAPPHMQPPWGIAAVDYHRYEAFNYTHCMSLAGVPAAVVPAGSQDGLPIGVQVVSGPYQEHVALAAALAVESASR
jgi:Asp-tRNA(Asn)/Glu-tRNA(Gln) amidotransferase A subunit family amidase